MTKWPNGTYFTGNNFNNPKPIFRLIGTKQYRDYLDGIYYGYQISQIWPKVKPCYEYYEHEVERNFTINETANVLFNKG